MDGLTLAEKIRQRYPSMKVVIFSGYDDFEYAQKAIKLNVTEYILKPVNVEELTSILKRADRAVYEIVADASRGNFQGKKIITYDLSNDGVGITDPRAFTAAAGQNAPPDLERRLKELRAELLSGSIRLKSLRARTLCDCL